MKTLRVYRATIRTVKGETFSLVCESSRELEGMLSRDFDAHIEWTGDRKAGFVVNDDSGRTGVVQCLS